MKNGLSIKNLSVARQDKQILKSLSLHVAPGELHVLVGPNGSGKSTLAHVLAGDPRYVVTEGSVTYDSQDLLALRPEERARRGLFVAFQYPVEIPGLSLAQFLQAVSAEQRRARGQAPLSPTEFLAILKKSLAQVGLSESALQRPLNVGFSGGEKKRLELLQLLLLEPTLAILDEIDSGIDAEGSKLLVEILGKLRSPDRSLLVITHNAHFVSDLRADREHHLKAGTMAPGIAEVGS